MRWCCHAWRNGLTIKVKHAHVGLHNYINDFFKEISLFFLEVDENSHTLKKDVANVFGHETKSVGLPFLFFLIVFSIVGIRIVGFFIFFGIVGTRLVRKRAKCRKMLK